MEALDVPQPRGTFNKGGVIFLRRPDEIDDDRLTVMIPDLYVSIMSKPRTPHPLYEKFSYIDNWMSQTLGLGKVSKKFLEIQVTYLCACMLQNSSELVFECFARWMNWVLFFDDRIDSGNLTNDPLAAAIEIISTLSIQDKDHQTVNVAEHRLRYTYHKLWEKINMHAPQDARARLKRGDHDYMIGTLQQIKWMQHGHKASTTEQYFEVRRRCCGVRSTVAFCEWAVTEKTNIPCEVIEHPSVTIFRELSVDVVAIVNDIISAAKDIPNQENFNIIIVLLGQGYSLQEAMDEAGRMVDDRCTRWEQALKELPTWGDKIDAGVLRLVEAYSDVCWGNLEWSFHTARYLGDERERVRATRLLTFSAKDVRRAQRPESQD